MVTAMNRRPFALILVALLTAACSQDGTPVNASPADELRAAFDGVANYN